VIYVRRDPALIPEKVLRVAERAQAELEALAPEKRAAFIEKKAHVWRAFARYLAKMSYGKCWYSESDCVQSFKDVDHYRPKKQAKRTDTESDDGYPWLAFSWDNFRLAAQRSNQINRDDDTDASVGKGAWFPLLQGSKRATWDDRCVDEEHPMLLDPTIQDDVKLVEINPDDGRAIPSLICVGPAKQTRVARSIELYGLNLGNLITARKRVMREAEAHYQNLMDIVGAAHDMAAIERLTAQMRTMTQPSAPYARAARSKLHSMGAGAFCASPEDIMPVG
jgi:hypothetical protein